MGLGLVQILEGRARLDVGLLADVVFSKRGGGLTRAVDFYFVLDLHPDMALVRLCKRVFSSLIQQHCVGKRQGADLFHATNKRFLIVFQVVGRRLHALRLGSVQFDGLNAQWDSWGIPASSPQRLMRRDKHAHQSCVFSHGGNANIKIVGLNCRFGSSCKA